MQSLLDEDWDYSFHEGDFVIRTVTIEDAKYYPQLEDFVGRTYIHSADENSIPSDVFDKILSEGGGFYFHGD